jgi:hypothetical protein
MKSLEQEALEYADGNGNNSLTINSFLAGADSKYVKAEIIKAHIGTYLHCIPFIDDEEYRIIVRKRIEIGEQLLKELKD